MRIRTCSLWLVAAAAGGLLAGACNAVFGVDALEYAAESTAPTTGTGTGTGTGSGTPPGTTTGTNTDCGGLEISTLAACQSCAEANCCSEMAACDTSLACRGLWSCATACTDQACVEECSASYPDGITLINALMSCVDPLCTQDCTVAGICGSDMSYGIEALDSCLSESCCESFTPCDSDANCHACLVDPNTTGCDGNALLNAFDACADTSCPLGICTSSLGFADGDGTPSFACNACAGEHCCSAVEVCDGDGSEAAVELCVTCVTTPDDPACTANPTVHDAAVSFVSCVGSMCSVECS